MDNQIKVTINIIGNICSGKSTLINKIKKQTTYPAFFSIDEYRERYSDGSLTYDSYCWERMIDDVAQSHVAIVESSGVSQYFNKLCDIPDRAVINVLLDIDTITSIERWKNRPKKGLGIESIYEISDSVHYIERRLQVVKTSVDINARTDEMSVYRDFYYFIKENNFIQHLNSLNIIL